MKLTAVVYLQTGLADAAAELAAQFGVPFVDGVHLNGAKTKYLQAFLTEHAGDTTGASAFVMDADGLKLYALGANYGVAIAADFYGATVTYRRKLGGGKGQMIAKAVGLRSGLSPRVLDATAGLGGDAFVLASLGCQVTMLERAPEVRALLSAGLDQARNFAQREDAELGDILERMQLVHADSHEYLKNIEVSDRPDAIYLDPMFPERTKGAMVKKEMRVFHDLVGADLDADGLLDLAMAQARYRVVVKRPRIAPTLGDSKPNHVLEGKSNRYDIYTIAKMPDDLGRK